MSDDKEGNSVNLLERLQGAFNAPTQQNPIMSNPPQGNPTQTPPMRTHMPPQGMYPYAMAYPPIMPNPMGFRDPNQPYAQLPQQPNMMFSRGYSPIQTGPPLSSLESLTVQNATPPNMQPPATNQLPPPTTSDVQSSSSTISDPAVLRRSSGSISLPINNSAKNTLPSPSAKKRQIDAPGVILSGTKVTINTDIPVSNNVQELEVQAITLYSSEYGYHNGSLIAVNKRLICYTVKGDLIRVISRKTASRDLLKGHTLAVTELQFINDDGDLLASGGADGKILIWKIVEISDKDPITHELLHQINGSTNESIMRIAWHPNNSNIIVSADKDNIIRVYDRSSLPQQVQKSQCHVALQGNTEITDISFGQDGQLAVAHSDKVSLYDVLTGRVILTLNPHDKPVDSVAFCPSSKSSQLLVTGASLNSDLKLWDISSLKCLQFIQIHSPSQQKPLANHFAFDKSGAYMFLVNSKEKNIYSFRVNPGSQDSQPMFEYLTEFSIAQPVLSFMITNHERISSKPNTNSSNLTVSEMQLHCVQTKAIQTYYVNSEQCYSKIGNVSSPAVTEEKLNDHKPVVVTNLEVKIKTPPKKSDISIDQPKDSSRSQEKAPEVEKRQEKAQETPLEVSNEPELKPPPIKTKEPIQEKQNIPEGKTEINSQTETSDPSLLTPSFFKSTAEVETAEILNQILNNVDQSYTPSEVPNTPSTPTTLSTSSTPSSTPSFAPSTPTKEPEPTPKKEEAKKKKKNKNTEEDATPNTSISSTPQNKSKGQKIKQEATEDNNLNKEKAEKKETNKIVVKEEPKLDISFEMPALSPDSGIAAQLGNMMQFHMEKLYQRLETERKEREKLERERQEKLLEAIAKTLNTNMGQQMEKIIHKELQTVIVPAIGKIMVGILENSLLKPLQENFKKIMLQSIGPKLEAIVKESITSKQLGAEVATNIGDSIKQPVNDAFSQYFQNVLIPSFEKSCQTLFVQLHHTFEKGVQERTQYSGPQSIVRNDNSVDHMKVAVQALVEATASMSKTIVDTQNKILNDHIERQARSIDNGGSSMDKEASSFQQMTKELIPLINSKKYEEAFSTTLSARNVQLLTWLCSRMDPHAVFSMRPLPISQYVLLSLIQQLGFDLTKDTELKLNWLREAALVLDLNDPVLAEHAPQILSKLLRKLEEYYPKHQDANSAASVKLLMHVVNSLLKQ